MKPAPMFKTRLKSLPLALALSGLLGLGLNAGTALADPPPWAGHGNGHGHDRDDNDRGAPVYVPVYPSYAPDRRDNRDDNRDHDRRGDRHDDRGHDYYRFSTREQFYIQDWYRRNGPPGHRYGMPPGQAKKLMRGAPWPPPYAYEPLPPQIVRGLQPLPPGYRYYRVGADVIIANLAGNVVADVVYDLLNR